MDTSAGASDEQIARALGRQKYTLGIVEAHDLVPIPADLARQIATDLETALAEEPADGWQRLDEKVVDFISEARVEIYYNEGQHRGRPHVAVILKDGKVSVSLDDPPVLLTKNGYRGDARHSRLFRQPVDSPGDRASTGQGHTGAKGHLARAFAQ